MLKENLTDGNFIEIAPFGRGTSNCFTTDYAEKDVKEAIDDAILNYPIDTSRIIIAGFSMGGYGAYRIFYEYPGLFKGVVVFSGHPNLAGKWIGEGYPDFLNPTYLEPFKNIPVFIYHSKNDLNCPYDLTEELVAKLKKTGAKVEFITTEEGGHGILNDSYTSVYLQWLKNLY
ncbi:MAG: prolyl oligopeptidase family serine peptidase [Bacteroidales bacterium]|nr:prolyl oligopeptidase family serine peptidase [Bacteroidales bacterium]